jgi:hypothetical protein
MGAKPQTCKPGLACLKKIRRFSKSTKMDF